MAWTIKRIEAGYFMGYRRLDLDLSSRKGITSVEGSRGAPGTSNGAAKSTIFEAIYWCLKGKLMRRQRKADKVRNRWMRPDENTFVRLTIDVDGVEFIPERTRSKSGSTLRHSLQGASSTIEGTQAVIDRVLGLPDDRSLTSTAIFSGSLAQFCQLTDAERKAALERMIGADHFGAAAERAGVKQAEHEAAAARLLASAEQCTREVDMLLDERQRTVASLLGLAVARNRREKELRAAVRRAAAASDAAHDELEAHHREALTAESALAEVRGKLEERVREAKAAIDAADAAMTAADRATAVVNAQIQALRIDRSNLESGTHPDTCSKCGQRWPHEGLDQRHLEEALKKLDDKVLDLRRAKAPHEADRATAEQARAAAVREKGLANGELEELAAAVDSKVERRLLTAALQAEATLNAALAEVARHYADSPDPEWGELNTECPEVDAKITATKERRRKLQDQHAAEAARAKVMAFWKKGFGRQGMPAFLLDSSIPAMNETVGKLASALSNGELSVSFDPAAAKGSGDVFAVNVEYADGADDYDMSSNGEHTRVDLPVMFTLRDVVERRGGNYCTQMFLDEVFEGTDAAFAESMIGMLRTFYGDRDIFIISHDDSVKALCDNTILVVKSGRDSVIA